MKYLFHILIAAGMLFLVATPSSLFANIGLQNPISADSITEVIEIVVRVIRFIAIPFVVIMIMYVGFLYIWHSAFSEPKEMANVHRALGWTLLGVFLILSAELIAIAIRNTLK